MANVSSAEKPRIMTVAGVELNIGALLSASPRYWGFVAGLLILVGLGLVAWVSVIVRGPAVFATRDVYPWGLWFTNYMYYVGLSAGGLVVYSSVHLFGAKRFEPLARVAVLQAAVLVMMALLSVATDFERPWRLLWFFRTPNLTAPFVYTGSAANLYFILCVLDLWILLRGKGGERLAFAMTVIALPAAIYLHSTTAWVLALQKSRELWNAAIMVPIFLSSATASGIALLLLFAHALRKVTRMRLSPALFRSLATLLATVIAIDSFLLFVEVLTILWPTSGRPGHVIRMMEFLTGKYSVAFLPVIGLGLASFAILARRRTRHLAGVQIAAAALYVTAIFLKRFVLMAMGFSISPIGPIEGFYLPSLVELLLAVGILGLGLLIVTVAVKVLRLEVPEEGQAAAPERLAGLREALDEDRFRRRGVEERVLALGKEHIVQPLAFEASLEAAEAGEAAEPD